jgi:hypothetical protein
MIDEEARAYLDETHIATFVSLNEDGSPHSAPVWYECRGDMLYFIMRPSSIKVRNIQRDSRVAVSIANDNSPAKYVLVEGHARVTEHDANLVTYEMCQRYRGEKRGPQSAKEMLGESGMVVVVVEPAKVMSWMGEG